MKKFNDRKQLENIIGLAYDKAKSLSSKYIHLEYILYAVLKNSPALIFEFKMQAKTRGIITPKTEVAIAKTIVFINILKNNGSVKISL